MSIKTTFTHSSLFKTFVLLLFLALALALLTGQARAASVTLDVTPSGGAYNSIQDAINATLIGFDTVKIRVAEGRYQQSLNIGQAKDLTIEGGWNSSFTNRDTNRATIVNGSDIGAAIAVNPGSTVIIDGITATHGSASGLHINNSTVTVRNSKIGRNHNIFRGGGVYAYQSTLIIEDSLVSENSVIGGSVSTDATVESINANGGGYGGGGIYASETYLTVRNSTIKDNYDNAGFNIIPPPNNSGGGLHLSYSEAVIENSSILDNLALTYLGQSNGGGIYSAASNLSLTNTIVAGNYANYEGGGLYFSNGFGQTQIDPPGFQGRLSGVGASTPNNLTIVNSTFANNAADDDLLLFAFPIFTDNSSGQEPGAGILNGVSVNGGGGARIFTGAGTSTVSILNSIFWGNKDATSTAPYSRTNDLDVSLDPNTTFNVSYSDIGVATGNPYVGPGNISQDPRFVDSNDNHLYDASIGNYHLKKYSPAIDTATSISAPADDLDGVSRPKGAGFDMGAYEEPLNFDTVAPKTSLSAPAYSINQSKSNRFKVKWSATDAYPSSGGLLYHVWVKRGYRGKWRLWRRWTPRTSGIYKGRRRKTYYFKVKAKDAAGNSGAFTKAKSTVVPADGLFGQFIKKMDGFTPMIGVSAFKRNYFGSVLRSTNKGDAVAYRLKTKQFTIFATKGRRNGKAKVYINGRFNRLINTNSRTSKYRQMVYKKDFRRTKYYTIKIVNVGRGSKARLDIDGLGAKR